MESISDKLKRLYFGLAITFFNLVAIFIILNFAAWILIYVWLKLRPEYALPEYNPVSTYGYKTMAGAYPGWSLQQLSELMTETWGTPKGQLDWEYDAITQIQPLPHRGRFVNVAPAGYRLNSRPAPWPPAPGRISIFVFGGSTTFGMGLTYQQTIPSQLQQLFDQTPAIPPVDVYNFGFSAYTSTQELLLYFKLLRLGLRPDIVVFIDGLNECLWYRHGWQEGDAFAAALRGASHASIAAELPLLRLVNGIIGVFKPKQPSRPPVVRQVREKADAIISRYETNRALINQLGKCFGTKVLLTWQPVPMYNYDIKYHFLYKKAVEDSRAFGLRIPLVQAVYPVLEARSRGGLMGKNFLWLGDIQEGLRENLYVDWVHYNPALSALIARSIYDYMIYNHWVTDRSGGSTETRPSRDQACGREGSAPGGTGQ